MGLKCFFGHKWEVITGTAVIETSSPYEHLRGKEKCTTELKICQRCRKKIGLVHTFNRTREVHPSLLKLKGGK